MATNIGSPITIVFTVNCSLMSTEIIGCAESLSGLGASFVVAFVWLVMPMVMLSRLH
jgi:hypothetical protein